MHPLLSSLFRTWQSQRTLVAFAIAGLIYLLAHVVLGVAFEPGFLMLAGPTATATLDKHRKSLQAEEQALVAEAEKAGDPDAVLAVLADSAERRDAIAASIAEIDAELGRENARRERDRNAPAAAAEEGPLSPLGPLQVLARGQSPADHYLADPTVAEWRTQMFANGVPRTSRLESPGALIPGSIFGRNRPQATIVTGGSSTSAGAFVVNDRTAIYDNALQRPLAIRDLITIGSTDSDTVEFVRATSQTNAAAGVAEADSATTSDETGLKPESAIAFEVVQPGVKTIAHWIPATNQAIADASQLRSIIDDFLRYGLQEQVEDDIFAGGGTTTFDGLNTTANIQNQTPDTDFLTTTRRARTKVRVGGRARPSAYVFHPNDWEEIDLELSLNGGGTNNRQAGDMSPPRLWGLPVVESEAVTEGTGWVADWRKAVLWDRMQTIIRVGQPDNFFLKNMVAVLAELRAAFGVIRPAAFVKIDFTGLGS